MFLFRLILESFRFAWNALRVNLLRTTLSLLGVTIGIFAIISVFTLVDSLEKSIKDSLSFLGRTNVDVRRFPFEFGPNVPWWDYMKRPYTDYSEYEFLLKNVQHAEGITIFSVSQVIPKYKSNSATDVNLLGISHGHPTVYADFDKLTGRYFTQLESNTGRNVAIIGHRTHKELFNLENAIGKQIKIKGANFTVIGTVAEEGEGLFGGASKDENIWIPFKSYTKIVYVGKGGREPILTLKGLESDLGLVQIESEVEGLLRKFRSLKAKQKSNFSIVRQQAILNSIGGVFDVISLAGWVIGGFSILVGGFGIANIMFVSVRERTNIIGIQKSLGAKNYFILFQFLFESVFLSVIGGAIGIFLVWLLSFVSLGSLDLVLSASNIALGLGVSAIIGMASGIIPAAMAARLDPVIAIRTQ